MAVNFQHKICRERYTSGVVVCFLVLFFQSHLSFEYLADIVILLGGGNSFACIWSIQSFSANKLTRTSSEGHLTSFSRNIRAIYCCSICLSALKRRTGTTRDSLASFSMTHIVPHVWFLNPSPTPQCMIGITTTFRFPSGLWWLA